MSTQFLNSREGYMWSFVQMKHAFHVRKYTGGPYSNHLLNVATLFREHEDSETGFVAAMCHDIIEDYEHTKCTKAELVDALIKAKYTPREVVEIMQFVSDLTDVYTSESFPDLNRTARKELEAHRLGWIDYFPATIKLCDLIDNTSSIVQHDKKFAKVYLKEKDLILNLMERGNMALRHKALNILESALQKAETI